MSKEPKGYVSFVLHAHLPFVHHPESKDYLEEQWLFEAISETYIPLLQRFQSLVDDKVDFRFTMSLTPPLLNMLDIVFNKKSSSSNSSLKFRFKNLFNCSSCNDKAK